MIVSEDRASGLKFVVDFGHGDDVAVAGEHGGGAADGRGDLEDFGVENDAGVAAWGGGADDVSPHGACGCVERDELVIDNDHVSSEILCCSDSMRISMSGCAGPVG